MRFGDKFSADCFSSRLISLQDKRLPASCHDPIFQTLLHRLPLHRGYRLSRCRHCCRGEYGFLSGDRGCCPQVRTDRQLSLRLIFSIRTHDRSWSSLLPFYGRRTAYLILTFYFTAFCIRWNPCYDFIIATATLSGYSSLKASRCSLKESISLSASEDFLFTVNFTVSS